MTAVLYKALGGGSTPQVRVYVCVCVRACLKDRGETEGLLDQRVLVGWMSSRR